MIRRPRDPVDFPFLGKGTEVKPTHPFVVDAVLFAIFGTVLGGMLFIAYSGNRFDQLIMCSLVSLPAWFVAICLATRKGHPRRHQPG